MSGIVIRIDPQDKALAKIALDPVPLRRAMLRGVNRTAMAARTTLSKTIRKSFFVKARAIKQATRYAKAGYYDLTAEITLIKPRHKGVPLSSFSTNRVRVGRGVGVSVKIRRDRPREIVGKRSKYSKYGHGAFKTKSGKVLERKGGGRYPVATPVGPTVIEMAKEVNALSVVERDAMKKLKKNVEREVAFQLRKQGAA